jgi:hypothetical protein
MNIPRRRTQVMLTAGLLCVSLAGCGVVTGASGGGGGQTVVSYDGYAGPALLSADQRTVTVAGFSYPCFGTMQPIARETSTRVSLWLKYETPAHHGACNSSMAMEGPRNIRLSAPLGGRLLIGGATGQPVHWFDVRRMLRPSVIPAGFKLQEITPLLANSLPAPATPGCRQEYLARGDATLSIVQSAGSLQLPQTGNRAPGAIRVRGYPGYASADGITWREGGYNILIEDFPGSGSVPVLTTAELITIADSAPPT